MGAALSQGGSGGGVAVALLSRGAAASCRWSQLQREQPPRPPHSPSPFSSPDQRGPGRRGEAEPRERGPGRPRGAVAAVTAAPGPAPLPHPSRRR